MLVTTAVETGALDIGLPKWPQMRVRGRTLPPERALEIIRRTDTFFTRGYDGNNRRWNRHVRETLGMAPSVFDDMGLSPEYSDETLRRAFDEVLERRDAWETKWDTVVTEYVFNSWVSCSFIGGPHGWCHPDGTVFFADNVGKYPSVAEVLDDWERITTAFPGLDLDVLLMNAEGCEDGVGPSVGFVIRDSVITVCRPEAHNWFATFGGWDISGKALLDEHIANMVGVRREVGIDGGTLNTWRDYARTLGLVK